MITRPFSTIGTLKTMIEGYNRLFGSAPSEMIIEVYRKTKYSSHDPIGITLVGDTDLCFNYSGYRLLYVGRKHLGIYAYIDGEHITGYIDVPGTIALHPDNFFTVTFK